MSTDNSNISLNHDDQQNNYPTKQQPVEDNKLASHLKDTVTASSNCNISISPYLQMNGNCAEAVEFYRSVFRGEILALKKYGERPGSTVSDEIKDKILHASLRLQGATIMMCDAMDNQPTSPYLAGTNVQLCITADTVEEAERMFNELSVNGNIRVPFAKQFWGGVFGLVRDKYDIHWQLTANDH